MTGLFGYLKFDRQTPEPGVLEAMASAMEHDAGLMKERTSLPGFGAGRVHLGVFQPDQQPAVDPQGRLHAWFDGEVTNRSSLTAEYGLGPEAPDQDAALFLSLYRRVGWEFLPAVDGLFAMALFDAETRELTLVTDRYGSRPIYWVSDASIFGYAGEVKALLELPGIQPTIDTEAVATWFTFGFLLGNRTWIQGAQTLPAATILSVTDLGIFQRRYWDWNQVPRLPSTVREEDAARELGVLWTKAVSSRVDQRRVGQLLSGGLDSRAILAGVPSTAGSYPTVTFGARDSDDIQIAGRAAKRKGVPHHTVEIQAANWLPARLEAVWRTDGMASILHLHGAEAVPMLGHLMDVVLHGSMGDGIVGASHWFPTDAARGYVEAQIVGPTLVSNEQSAQAVDSYVSLIEKLGSADSHYIEQRQRRLISNGLTMLSARVEPRLPFADNAFLTFALGIPPELRIGARIYRRMLVTCFPELFADIPWQKTGLPLAGPAWRMEIARSQQLIRRALRGIGRRAGLRVFPTRGMVDYVQWMRSEPARTFVADLLLGPDAIYPAYLAPEKCRASVRDFLEGGHNDPAGVGLLLTFELFLCRVFDARQDKLSLA